jgi:hypothetical protein
MSAGRPKDGSGPTDSALVRNARVLDSIVRAYLNSHDFNGILGQDLAAGLGMSWDDVKEPLRELISIGAVEIVHQDWFPNPHVRPFESRPVGEQISKLTRAVGTSLCVYPTSTALAHERKPRRYAGRPFATRLWRGEPQLRPVFFDLAILETYRSDPRYYFQFHDNGGLIGVKDDYFASSDFPERDKVLIQTFGIGYDQSGGRVLAVFLRYLADLTPEHQRIWETFERDDPCRLDADYFRNAMGEFSTHGSMYRALLLEQAIINEMCEAIERPHLFRRTFADDRPPGYHVFFRPTLANLHAFVLELDKLLSQNLDTAFFQGEVSAVRVINRRDRSRVEQPRGTLDQLDEWLHIYFRTQDASVADSVIQPLRRIRRDRQTPAHVITENKFDPGYWTQQDEIMESAYSAIRTLRLILANYPGAETVQIPDWIQEGRIRLH